ncbi:SDR family NAD(P)-dependent oxidoreductase [Amycolatopsis pithecellobii]|uniref:SDR family oxidoreductase n=1 Tax=Amycolatopsis pithecellobii TaxID=664692 RepID=A0A6N7Z307_9PSEU|nr:SDR family oxidoreductase [Amycolatopsis pithecellobii]MTD54314.1 SDR family oxidoreductase [Amycolatopsis pithecellobii]
MGALDDQVALVTGAGRAHGIGRAVALRLASAGADVAVCDIARPVPELEAAGVGLGDDPAELEQTAELVRRLGRRSVAIAMDVSNRASADEGVAALTESLGGVGVLVNNAGSAVGVAPFEQISDTEWETSWRVNVLGAVNLSRAVLPGMKEAGRGTIINIASTLGVAALAEYGAYVPAKHAVVGLTRLLAQELAPFGIRTNAVAPGYIVTDMGKAEQAKIATAMSVSVSDAVDAILDEIPVGRLGAPDDVANAVAWLADPASSFVNGAILPVHGGQTPGFA